MHETVTHTDFQPLEGEAGRLREPISRTIRKENVFSERDTETHIPKRPLPLGVQALPKTFTIL